LSAAGGQVALGVHRLGSDRVNFYLVEDEGRVTIVDAGISGYWDQVEPALEQFGRGLDDVAAIVLTHAHSDHTGVAGKLHERGLSMGVPVYLHPADHELLKTGKESWKREGSALSVLRHPRVFGFFAHMARNGALRPPHIADPVSIVHDDRLDVPGNPRVIHTPGHTPGHCALHFERHGALFVGDLLCTWHPVLGRRGPQIMPAAFNVSSAQALESLARIEDLSAGVVLPGHGEPWASGPADAAAQAREFGPS
jgi:glyoxylase-like metal-dependent hydrolase (beta-lactamase superfamily II)